MKDEGKDRTIGALAAASGVNVETIRFYQRRGLLREPRKPAGGIRRYEENDLARVRFIRIAQRLGFTLDEVGSLLKLDDGAHCSEAAEIAQHKLLEVRARLADLSKMEAALADLTARCKKGRGRISCPMIEALHEGSGKLAAGEVVTPGGRGVTGGKRRKRRSVPRRQAQTARS